MCVLCQSCGVKSCKLRSKLNGIAVRCVLIMYIFLVAEGNELSDDPHTLVGIFPIVR